MRALLCVALFVAVTTVAAADSLFNGKDLSGWKNKDGKTDADKLDGKTEALKGRIKVADGAIVIEDSKKGGGWIETNMPIDGDVTIRFEFNPTPGCNNDTQFRGNKVDIRKDQIKNMKENDWNTFEIRVKDGKAEYRCNDVAFKTAPVKEPSPFALRAEFGGIKVRKLEVVK